MFEPPAKRDKDQQHRRGLKERLRVRALADNHRDDDDGDRVDVRDAGREADQHVHVGLSMSQRPQCVHVEIPTSQQLSATATDAPSDTEESSIHARESQYHLSTPTLAVLSQFDRHVAASSGYARETLSVQVLVNFVSSDYMLV